MTYSQSVVVVHVRLTVRVL